MGANMPSYPQACYHLSTKALELSVELFGLQSDETDGATFLAKLVLASEWTNFLETMSIRAQETFLESSRLHLSSQGSMSFAKHAGGCTPG